MALTKQFLKSRPVCKVKFAVSSEEAEGREAVYVVGDFNDWSETANPMKKLKDGSFSLTIDLETGREYRFRYFSDGAWFNDPDADAYSFCTYATEDNSVISV